MSFAINIAFFLVSALAFSHAIVLPFTDCGNGSVKEVSIPQCSSSPCILKHGQNIQIKAVITSKISARSAKTSITGNVRGRDLPFPADNVDLCAARKISPSCPVSPGKSYTYTTNFKIEKIIPATNIMVTYKGLNEKGEVLACAKVPIQVKKN